MTAGWSFAVGLVIAVVCVVLARPLARHKKRTPGPWALAALLVGPIALAVLALVPAKVSDPRPSVTP